MSIRMKYTGLLLAGIIALFFIGAPVKSVAQAYTETFGQNRIQYRKYEWKYFDTKHFRIYHYDRAGRQLGRYVAEEAEKDINVVEQKLGGQFPNRFNIILYNSYDEYRQTNAGLKEEAQVQENTLAGTVNLVGDKLVVYFTGEHKDLRHQILSGMSRVVMERMIFGDNFRKMVKNALLLNLPAWVTDGYIAYLVDGWDTKTNSEWKSILDARPNAGFNNLSEQYPEIAGKAFWKYVSESYGNNKVKNLLEAIQQKTSLNKGMKEPQTLHMKVTAAYDSCIAFYKRTYAADALHEEQPDSTKGLLELNVPKDNTVIRSVMVSPKGGDVAYVAMKEGEFSVYIQKTQNEKERSLVLEGGRKDFTEQNDPDYPMLAWSNNGYKLAILFKKGTQTRLRIYNSLKARIENYVIPGNRFDRVLGMTFMEEDDKLVFSAIRKSQTDLYQFTIKGSRMTNITNDAWDDIQPTFISGGTRRGILFLSNRPAPNLDVPLQVNELPTGPMNVFFYDTKTKRPELLQCSNVKTGRITQPIQYGSENFAFLYDTSGIQNKYVVLFGRDRHNMDSAYAVPITNYASNIISHQYNPASNEVADVVQQGDKFDVYFHPLQMPGVNATVKTLTPTTLSRIRPGDTVSTKPVTHSKVYGGRGRHRQQTEPAQPSEPEIKGGNAFQSEFTDTTTNHKHVRNVGSDAANETATELRPEDSSLLTVINDSAYLKMKASAYKLSFKPDYFTVRVDNSLLSLDNTTLFNQYQPYTGQYTDPPVNILAKFGTNDMMEDYRITAGLQLPIDLSGTTYFLQYENFRNKIDWGITYLRSNSLNDYLVTYVDNTNTPVLQKEQLGKNTSDMVQADFTYPLDRVRSFHFHTALRQDRLILKALDTLSLTYDLPNATTYTSMSRLEYIYDNTISPALNIRNGFRYKFYAEYLYQLNVGNRNCYNFGVDFRNYQKIYKDFIWATRIAYAHSDGNYEVDYNLGGVDGWVSPQYADPTSGGGPFGFQSLATGLRGYDQDAYNGNNYALINTELRLPIFTTFFKRPVQSAILKNLQIVAFVDAGSAWNGFLPTAGNLTQHYTFTNAVPGANNATAMLNIDVPNGAGLGYGGGLRTTVLGYFMRLDAAWNIQGNPKPIIYFSLGTDF